MEVAEHLEDPQSFTQELFRICKPDGMLLISTPTQISEELQRGIAAPNYFESPNHIQIFNEERFREVVSNAGFLVKSYNLEGFYWSLGMLFFWNSGLALDQAIDPVRQHWANTWKSLLEAPNGKEIKNRLDQLLPKTQIIIAQKPS
jgi:SAM-dependent methyltransferase